MAATLDCGFFYDGAIWVQPTEVHVWDGTSFVQAVQVFAYDGASWIEIFPCLVIVNTELTETSLILDSGQAVKISRIVIKSALELLLNSESISQVKRFTVTETSLILDTGTVVKISRDIIKDALELLQTSETGAISITTLPPIISSCSAEEVEADPKARVKFSTGNFCRSVRIDKSVDGNHSFHQNMNVNPNTANIFSSYYFGTCPEAVKFHVHPFTGTNQSGTEGNECNTTEVILGPPACK